MRRASLALLVAWLAGAALAPGRARGSDLPPRNQALLLLRILAYDRNLKVRAGPAVAVVVLYRAGDRVSEERRTALLNAFEEVSRDVVVAGLPVKVEAVPFRDGADLDAALLAVSEIVREAPPRGAVDGTGPTGAP